MPGRRHDSARCSPVARLFRKGSALLESIVAMTVVTLFLSGLHLTNSQVMAQVRASVESRAALRVLAGRSEQVRAATRSQVTDPSFLQTTLFAEPPDDGGELGGLSGSLEITAPLAAPGTVPPMVLSRNAAGGVSIVDPGDGTMENQISVRVDVTALWTGKGGRARTRQISLIIALGGLLGRN